MTSSIRQKQRTNIEDYSGTDSIFFQAIILPNQFSYFFFFLDNIKLSIKNLESKIYKYNFIYYLFIYLIFFFWGGRIFMLKSWRKIIISVIPPFVFLFAWWIDWWIDINDMTNRQMLFCSKRLNTFIVRSYLHFYCCFLIVFLLNIYLYDIKYPYQIQIICAKLNGFKYSYIYIYIYIYGIK